MVSWEIARRSPRCAARPRILATPVRMSGLAASNRRTQTGGRHETAVGKTSFRPGPSTWLYRLSSIYPIRISTIERADKQERAMQGVRSVGSLQQFIPTFAAFRISSSPHATNDPFWPRIFSASMQWHTGGPSPARLLSLDGWLLRLFDA